MSHMCRVSVIVPVYNVEEYLAGCLDSLAAQTLSKEEMEVLLINDGSPDGSAAICEQYAAQYPWIRYFRKENEGLSATRNYGLARAEGKYLMFLDSDDTYTPETLKSVVDFFDEHYDEVDLVTYRIQPYRNNRKLKPHFRYRYLRESGVYDLEEFPYITQTTMNVCTKNRRGEILFDTSPDFRHEDQKYCLDNLLEKLTIGFCDQGEYCYNKNNENSIVSTVFYAYYIFESTMRYYENLFASYEEQVPPYVQAMLIHDLNWKLNGDILFPYHYDKEQFALALERLRALVRRIDTEVLFRHPVVHRHQKLYWLKFGGNAQIEVGEDEEKRFCVNVDEFTLEKGFRIPVILRRQRVEKGILHFQGFIYTTYFTAAENETPVLLAEENGKLRPIEVYDSMHSYLHPMLRTSRIFAFRYSIEAASVKQLRFFVRANGVMIPTSLRRQSFGGSRSRFVRISTGGYRIFRSAKGIKIRKISTFRRRLLILRNTLKYYQHPRLFMRRTLAAFLDSPKRRVWLYNDLYTVEKDNAYYQFQHDFEKNDGVRRYYVTDREYEDLDKLFSEEQQKYLVKKGSFQHKMLYLCSERILTAFFGLSPTYPFDSVREYLLYEDIIHFRITYLQHGLLHASLHKSNHAELDRADEIVVSAPFEYENYKKNYGYTDEQLLPTGMARYDHIDRSRAPENRILLAPSWRKYMTYQAKPSEWSPVIQRIKSSEYYQGFMSFLENPRLHQMLDEKDFYLDVKLHPILSGTTELFDISHPRITLLQSDPPQEQYKVFITDFSSYVFDFAYLGRCIQYFVPDIEKFRAGMNHYRALDLPLEEAFGPAAYTADDAVENLCKLAEANFVPDELYQKRTSGFFYPLENCAEALYQKLK